MNIVYTQDYENYDTETLHVGNAVIVNRYVNWFGERHLVSNSITMSVDGHPNRFAGRDFSDSVDAVLGELRKLNPAMADDFKEAFKPELWYGKTTWTNTL